MSDIIVILSKYVIVFFMLCYTLAAFLVLRHHSVNQMKASYWVMNFCTICLHATGYAVVLLHERSLVCLLFYLVQLLYMILYLLIYRRLYPKANLALLSHMMMFLMLGFLIQTRLDVKTAMKQFILAAASSVVTLMVPAMFARVKAAKIWGGITGVVGLLLLLAVLVFGRATYGANLSLSFGGITLQPSEFVKISFVLMMAVFFRKRHDIRRILFATAITLAHVGVLILSRDLGAAAIFAVSYLMMLFTAAKNPFLLLGGAAAGAGGAVLAWMNFSHVQTRVYAWLNPWADYTGRGYQIGNSLFGIATGGWFGQGLYRGNPNLIPVVESDCIFSAVCEELGGIVGLCIIGICMACMLMFIHVAADLYLPFYKLTGIGLAVIYGLQVILNIGGVTRFIPSTGVTIPLISYGGSSLASTFIMFGIMQELYIKHQNEVERIERSRRYDSYEYEEDEETGEEEGE